MANKRPLEDVEQLEKLWSWVERFGAFKTMLAAAAGGGLCTYAVSLFQRFPRWLILILVFIVSSLLTLVLIAGVLWLLTLIKRKTQELLDKPLQRRVVALEQTIGPRQIGEVQRQHLLQKLSTEVGSIKISAIKDDDDALAYAEQFASLFREAGWNVWGVERPYITRLGSYDIGVTLLSQNFATVIYHPVEIFNEALGAAGITFNYYVSWELAPNSCELIVGHRGKIPY